jgi:WD40 repeat protein
MELGNRGGGFILRGHTSDVRTARFSHDGLTIVTASADRTARIWDTNRGNEIAVLLGHGAAVTAATFSNRDDLVVTASEDGTVRIWDAATGKEIAVLCTHQYDLIDVAYSSKAVRILAASHDGTITICEGRNLAEIAVIRAGEGRLRSARFSPDGTRVVALVDGKPVRVWRLDAPPVVDVEIEGHVNLVVDASFSPQGSRIVTASYDGTARVWNAATGEEIAICCGHTDKVGSAAFSPEGGCIVTSSKDRSARIWEATTGKELAVLRGHDHRLRGAEFSPDGNTILTVAFDKTARTWQLTKASEAFSNPMPRVHDGTIVSASFRAGVRFVTATLHPGAVSPTVRIWNGKTWDEIATLSGYDAGIVRRAALSPGGDYPVTSADDSIARIWRLGDGQAMAALDLHAATILDVSFPSSGARAATASGGTKIRILDIDARTELTAFERGIGKTAFFSPGGDLIVFVGIEGVQIRNATTGGLMAAFDNLKDIAGGAFSPVGPHLVVLTGDRIATVYDFENRNEIAVLHGHEDAVYNAAFSDDGNRVVTASYDHTVRIWDALKATELTSFTLDAAVTALAVQGGDIAVCDAFSRIHLFDAQKFLSAAGAVHG